jgi:hypothetical protein
MATGRGNRLLDESTAQSDAASSGAALLTAHRTNEHAWPDMARCG